jgi:hypothetical protein
MFFQVLFLLHQNKAECKEDVIEGIVEIARNKNTKPNLLGAAIATLGQWSNLSPSFANKLLEAKIVELLLAHGAINIHGLHALVLAADPRSVKYDFKYFLKHIQKTTN